MDRVEIELREGYGNGLGMKELDKGWLAMEDILKPLVWGEVFGNENPVQVELGAGDGGFILQYAAQRPERNFLAVERLLGRSRKIVKRSLREGLENLRTLRLESFYTVKYLCPRETVEVLHIMFPDPWPKRRHHRRRLIQDVFLDAAWECLVDGGELRFSTDHEEYFRWTEEVFNGREGWVRSELWDWEGDPLTDFQIGFEREGRVTHRGRWRKVEKRDVRQGEGD